MNNFIQLLKPLKTPAKYLLYFLIAFVLFYLFGQPPEFRDEVTKKIRLYAENYIDPKTNPLENGQQVAKEKEWVEKKKGMTRIRNTQADQTCGNIKYSIVNLGPDDYTGHSRFDHIVANVFNNDGGTALKADSTESIK
jgi:hypothetical protein